MNKVILAAAITFLTLGAADRLSANLIIAIDQTGANNPVNINNARAWNFGITSVGAAYFSAHGLSFNSALLDAKIHNNTTAPLVFTIYSGLGGNVNGNAVLTTLSLPSSEFDQQYADDGGNLFTFRPQLFTKGYYSVTVTSRAPDNSTQDYFLKQGKLTLLDSHETPLDSAFWLQDQGTGNATGVFNGTGSLGVSGVALVPEVSGTWALALIGVVSFGGAFLRGLRRKMVPVAV